MSLLRDTVLIGGSAGALGSLRQILAQLPADSDASILAVLHQSPESPRWTVDVLRQSSRFDVQWGKDGEPIRPRTAYLAPPDRHMIVAGGGERLGVFYGPRENRWRPSIDTTFRSAAAERKARTIGVLLSGMLDDGVAGLEAIQRAGGLAVIQDPEDADYPQLPRNGIDTVDPDAVGNVPAMVEFLVQSIGRPVPAVEAPLEIVLEARLAGPAQSDERDVGAIGALTPVTCPECGGPMWEVGQARAKLYRCHVGHAHSPRTILREQDHEIERSLWTAVRTLQERANVLQRLAREHTERGHDSLSSSLTERATEARQQAERVRRYVFELLAPTGTREMHEASAPAASGNRRPPRP